MKERDFKVVIAHGVGGRDANWMPSIYEQLTRINIDVAMPSLPTQEPLKSKPWVEGLDKDIKGVAKKLCLVGYSLGSRTILLYIDKYQPKVDTLILVAPFANSKDNAVFREGRYKDFFQQEIDTQKVIATCDKRVVVHSVDDQLIPYSQGASLAGELKARLVSYQDRGHLFDPDDADVVLRELDKTIYRDK